jgi:hypothetical protein
MAPFRGAVIGNDIDDAVKKMVHVALMTLCERSLAITVDAPLALFLIRNQEEPVWQQHHEAVCDITSPQFSFQCSHLAKYTRYLSTCSTTLAESSPSSMPSRLRSHHTQWEA